MSGAFSWQTLDDLRQIRQVQQWRPFLSLEEIRSRKAKRRCLVSGGGGCRHEAFRAIFAQGLQDFGSPTWRGMVKRHQVDAGNSMSCAHGATARATMARRPNIPSWVILIRPRIAKMVRLVTPSS